MHKCKSNHIPPIADRFYLVWVLKHCGVFLAKIAPGSPEKQESERDHSNSAVASIQCIVLDVITCPLLTL